MRGEGIFFDIALYLNLCHTCAWGPNTTTDTPEWTTDIPTPVWRVDAARKLVWCNVAYAALYGIDCDAAITNQKIIAAKTGRVHLTTKGTRRLYDVTLAETKGGGHVGTAVDITTEETLQGDIKRTRTATRDLLHHLSTAIVSFNADQKVEFYNIAFAHLWGLDEGYLASNPKLGDILERLRDGRRLPEQADFRRYKQGWIDMFTTLIDSRDDMMYLPDGTALRMVAVPNPSGGLIFTFEDVTSRLELETSYNTLVAVQRETLDNLHEGIAVFGGDGRLKLWNPAFARLWALNPEDLSDDPHITALVGRVSQHFSIGKEDATRNQILGQVLSGTDMSGRMVLRNDRLIAFRATVLPDGGMLLSHTDVTDSVRVENALRDKNDALEAAERLKLDFLANVSYQLRTPLNAIMGFTEILDHEYFGPLNDKQKQYTVGTRAASEKLLGLIDDILDLSTIEAGYMKLDFDDVNIVSLLPIHSNPDPRMGS
jgi:PAS domain-containing protein